MQRITHGEARSPEGARVVIFEETWFGHIVAAGRHSELAPYLDSVLQTIAAPDHREPDERPGRERFFREGVGPSHWLMVVVDFSMEPARIVTALGYRHGRSPHGWID